MHLRKPLRSNADKNFIHQATLMNSSRGIRTITMGSLENEYAFQEFFDKFFEATEAPQESLVLDLRSLSNAPGLDIGAFLEEGWLSLTEHGLGMAILVVEKLVSAFRDRTFARCPVTSSQVEANKLAAMASPITPLSEEVCEQLDRIEIRFRELVNKRIGHLWKNGPPPYPPIVRLYKCGILAGHFPFPYGAYHWRFEEAESIITLKYDDYARVSDGWGCAYSITSQDTCLTQEGL